MKAHEIMDYLQRKINSVLFRAVLISYSLLLINLYENIFHPLTYTIGTIAYIVLFVKLDRNDKFRLVNDFVFINLIIIGKNPNEALIFTLLILPIINSINFSGLKKSVFLYIITTLSYFLLLFFFQHKENLEFSTPSILPLYSILFLWAINRYTELRMKIKNFRDELNSTVDNFYLKKEEIKRPHKIYKQLIGVIHRNTQKIAIEDIICFTIHENKPDRLVLTNGSSFIWSFKFKSIDIVEEIKSKKNLSNIDLILDGKEKNKNLLLYSKVEDQEYIFVIITQKYLPFYYSIIGFFNRTLEPALKKISNILLSEKRLQEIRNEEITRLSQRSQYVNRANKTMHYIRNRLGPFSNLVRMLEEFKNIPTEKIDLFRELIFKETENARTELKNITSRANNMLEKSSNPFVYTRLNEISIERVYTILKRNVYSFFPNIEIDIKVDPDSKKKYILFNEEGFELFLSDWLNNMLKYMKEKAECRFYLFDSHLEIMFGNDHKLSKQDIDKLISDLTSDDRNEIMRRTTHGLYTIKLTLEDMSIPFEATSSGDDLILKLKLKTYVYESSSI